MYICKKLEQMKNLTKTELLECLHVNTCEAILKDLQLEIKLVNGKKVITLSNEIFLIEKAIRLKKSQISLIGNL